VHLIVGPPASGRTELLLEKARTALKARKRVWWLCLPHQRSYVYRRVAAGGAVLGLEVLSFQQAYYRLLAASYGLRPILTGPARVALVGEALQSESQWTIPCRDGQGPCTGSPPNPGEARLFARAVAEAKRYGVRPEQIPAPDSEGRRFKRVFERYEELKGTWGRWDYDDFRDAAVRLVESADFEPPADLVLVDGFRELLPLVLRFLEGLGRVSELWVTLPEAPPGYRPHQTLSHTAGQPPRPQIYRAPNPVAEARWVLRSLKRDLAQGMAPTELAVVAPEPRLAALLSLADEYGVPLVDHTPRTATDTPEGRLLLDLLELPDYPTPTRLLAIPELAPLGRAALEAGLAGLAPIQRLAQQMGLQAQLSAWLERLEPTGNPEAWARSLLDSIPEVRVGPRRDLLLERAKEAGRIAYGPDFRRWWAALLSETYEPVRPPGGVPLLTPTLASGVRFAKLYLTHAVEGAYGASEQEDYFVAEEERLALEELYARIGLPRRFLGRDRPILHELATRAHSVIITYPEADQSGPLEPEAFLVPDPKRVSRIPATPIGSRLELPGSAAYRPPSAPINLGSASVEDLRRYDECGFRFWAERLRIGPERQEPAGWRTLVRELRALKRLNEARLEALSKRFPEAEDWLGVHRELLFSLNFGFVWPEKGMPYARVDAAANRGGEYSFYTFAPPDTHDPGGFMRGRWGELWLAGYLLEHNPRQVKSVRLWVWPVLGSPLPVYDKPISQITGPVRWRNEKVRAALERYRRGEVEPNPGFICRECQVKDLCREGKMG
jgi:ATP-dependent helicase/nuclease subunit B